MRRKNASLLANGQPFPSLGSRDKPVQHADGSTELCKIQQRVVTIRDAMTIEGLKGETLATVKKALITPLRDRWTVKVGDGPDLQVQGNILNHQYTIGAGSSKVAEVSKRWFRLADTYGVLIEPNQNDDVVILAVTVAIDMMAHP